MSFTLINEKMVEIQLNNGDVYAKQGGMVAYRGDIKFARSFLAGGGVQNLAMRAVTNEGYKLMHAKGTGQIYFASGGLHVTVVPINNETLFVEADTLLAFDSGLEGGTMFFGNQGGVQGLLRGAVTGHGLFTTTLRGNGVAAILSDGNIIALDVAAERPVFVDPDAYVGHKGQLSSKIVTDTNWKTFIGQASGESYQMRFSGSGTVYIQASER